MQFEIKFVTQTTKKDLGTTIVGPSSDLVRNCDLSTCWIPMAQALFFSYVVFSNQQPI